MDASILSELRRKAPAPAVVEFASTTPLHQLHVSSLTFAENRYGIECVTDPERRASLTQWLDHRLRPMFEGRILPLCEDTLLRWRLIIEAGRQRGHTFSHPEESAHHFLVTIPAGNREDVLISEHMTWHQGEAPPAPTFAFGEAEGKLRVLLARTKWNAVADEVRVEFNKRLKQDGIKSGSWKTGTNPVSRLLGKELVLLAWAVEEADPALIPTAIRNWLGLVPEERWWRYTMTSAATGHALQGRGKGWRKAVRFALTENPVSDVPHAPPPVFELRSHTGQPASNPVAPKTARGPRRPRKAPKAAD